MRFAMTLNPKRDRIPGCGGPRCRYRRRGRIHRHRLRTQADASRIHDADRTARVFSSQKHSSAHLRQASLRSGKKASSRTCSVVHGHCSGRLSSGLRQSAAYLVWRHACSRRFTRSFFSDGLSSSAHSTSPLLNRSVAIEERCFWR